MAQNNYHITVICPHPQLVLMNKLDSKYRIMDSHDMLVDLNNYDLHSLIDTHAKEHGLNILIVESDPDLMTLYTELFTKRNINAVVTSESNECLLAIKERIMTLLSRYAFNWELRQRFSKRDYQIRPVKDCFNYN